METLFSVMMRSVERSVICDPDRRDCRAQTGGWESENKFPSNREMRGDVTFLVWSGHAQRTQVTAAEILIKDRRGFDRLYRTLRGGAILSRESGRLGRHSPCHVSVGRNGHPPRGPSNACETCAIGDPGSLVNVNLNGK
jgi:hypothetical protein